MYNDKFTYYGNFIHSILLYTTLPYTTSTLIQLYPILPYVILLHSTPPLLYY